MAPNSLPDYGSDSDNNIHLESSNNNPLSYDKKEDPEQDLGVNVLTTDLKKTHGIKSSADGIDFEDEELKEINAQDEEDFEYEWLPNDCDFTWRAAFFGSLVGGLIGLSNIYLGLKVGITQGASLFAVMMGGIVMKPVLGMLNKWNDTFKVFGPKEHTCFQSAATSAGGLNGGLTSAVIGLFWISQDPDLTDEQKEGSFYGSATDNVANVLLLVFSAVSFGVFMGVPFRKLFIEIQKLTFPDGFAAAALIKTLYKKGRDQASIALGKRQAKFIAAFSVIGFLAVIVDSFIPVLFTWPIFANLSNCGSLDPDKCLSEPVPEGVTIYRYWALASIWGWALAFDPVMLGTSFIVPQRVNLWFFGGAVLSHAIIGPICMAFHEYPDGYSYGEGYNYIFSKTLLWPAVFVVLVSALSDVIYEWRSFKGLFGIRDKAEESETESVEMEFKKPELTFFQKCKRNLSPSQMAKDLKFTFTPGPSENVDRSGEKTPFITWAGGLLIFLIISFIVMIVKFKVTWYYVLVTFIFSFFLGIVYLQILGTTNWGLVSLMGKTVVITIGLMGGSVAQVLFCGNMIGQTMSQLGDITSSYKTGFVVGASPHSQFAANCVGNIFGFIFTMTGFFIFTAGFPCIVEYDAGKGGVPASCPFTVPSTKSWYALAKAVVEGFSIGHTADDNITQSGLYISIGMSIFAVITNGLKFLCKRKYPEYYKKFGSFFPLYSVLLIPFIIPPKYAIATLMGGIIKFLWKLVNPTDEHNLKIQVGSGLVCGGAVGGCFYAILRIAGVDASLYWGVPGSA